MSATTEIIAPHLARERLPNRRVGRVAAFEWSDQPWHIDIGFNKTGAGREIFIKGPRADSAVQAWVDDDCILISYFLQCGARLSTLAEAINRPRDPDQGSDGDTGAPRISLIARALDVGAALEAEEAESVRAQYEAVPAWAEKFL